MAYDTRPLEQGVPHVLARGSQSASKVGQYPGSAELVTTFNLHQHAGKPSLQVVQESSLCQECNTSNQRSIGGLDRATRRPEPVVLAKAHQRLLHGLGHAASMARAVDLDDVEQLLAAAIPGRRYRGHGTRR